MLEQIPYKKFFLLFGIVFSVTLITFTSYALSTEATIEYYREGKAITLSFSEEDLKQVNADPYFVLKKLEQAGVKCCEPNRKISKCIWECCDGSQVRTCNETLMRALHKVWGK